MAKVAIILHAGPEELARALHGLLYVNELHDAGHEARLFFDGAGTSWVAKFEAEDFRYGDPYRKAKAAGLIEGVCSYCATAFQAKEAAQAAGLDLLDEAGGHPSLARLVTEGYQVITL